MIEPPTIASVVAAIPAPPGNSLSIGPLRFNYYGLMIALGVLAAVEIARRRWSQRGGDPEDMMQIATVGVPAGLIGARLYHVITDWKMYVDDPLGAFAIWRGGLGIPGGLLLGVAAGAWAARRNGITGPRLWDAFDAVIPGIPVAQAIGRIGNWFNQEIFGRPTDVPWALEVDPQYRPARYAQFETFHPTFLYEALLNLTLAALLVVADRSGRLRRGQILPLWIAGYGALRFVVESMRTDPASLILGVRVNHWISAIAVVVGLVWFWARRNEKPGRPFGRPDPSPRAEPIAAGDDSGAPSGELAGGQSE